MCACAYFGVHSEAVAQLPACVPVYELLVRPSPPHVCPMKGEQLSCLYFFSKINHDVTMNPS